MQRAQKALLAQISQNRCRSVLSDAERIGEHGQLGLLAAVRVADRHAVARVQVHRRRRARPHPPALEAPVDRPEPRDQRGGRRLDRHALVAGSFASSFSACSISVFARSRFPDESSFLTSFSTTRRL